MPVCAVAVLGRRRRRRAPRAGCPRRSRRRPGSPSASDAQADLLELEGEVTASRRCSAGGVVARPRWDSTAPRFTRRLQVGDADPRPPSPRSRAVAYAATASSSRPCGSGGCRAGCASSGRSRSSTSSSTAASSATAARDVAGVADLERQADRDPRRRARRRPAAASSHAPRCERAIAARDVAERAVGEPDDPERLGGWRASPSAAAAAASARRARAPAGVRSSTIACRSTIANPIDDEGRPM